MQSIIDSVHKASAQTERLQHASRDQVSHNAELRKHAADMEQGVRHVADGSQSILSAMASLNARLSRVD